MIPEKIFEPGGGYGYVTL